VIFVDSSVANRLSGKQAVPAAEQGDSGAEEPTDK